MAIYRDGLRESEMSKHYLILAAATADVLETLVSEHMEHGWMPTGGVSTTTRPVSYAQAVYIVPYNKLHVEDANLNGEETNV